MKTFDEAVEAVFDPVIKEYERKDRTQASIYDALAPIWDKSGIEQNLKGNNKLGKILISDAGVLLNHVPVLMLPELLCGKKDGGIDAVVFTANVLGTWFSMGVIVGQMMEKVDGWEPEL